MLLYFLHSRLRFPQLCARVIVSCPTPERSRLLGASQRGAQIRETCPETWQSSIKMLSMCREPATLDAECANPQSGELEREMRCLPSSFLLVFVSYLTPPSPSLS